MPEAQETLKEATTPMVDLDTTGKARKRSGGELDRLTAVIAGIDPPAP